MNKDKILGSLYGAAYGDSLGATTEFCTREEIVKAFPQGCTDYTESISAITKGITPGCVTDDFGSVCYFMKELLKNQGRFDRETAVRAILNWSKDALYYGRYAGSNTKAAVARLKDGVVIDEKLRKRGFEGANTNGGAMKAVLPGLLAEGDQRKAVEYTKILCWPTHYNSTAVSGACAIACAVCEAQQERATVESVLECAMQGAAVSRQELEEEGFSAKGPHLEELIIRAAKVGQKAEDQEELFKLLNDEVGTGIIIEESVPAVFAILAVNGDLRTSLYSSVNAGGDTDTISSMLGAILGGLYGLSAVPDEAIERICNVNKELKLKETIEAFVKFMEGKKVLL